MQTAPLNQADSGETQTDNLYQRQLDLEAEMTGLGTEYFHSQIRKAQEKGRESTTKHGQALIGGLVTPVAAAIRGKLSERGKPGVRANALVFLREVDPDVAAYITIKTIFDGICKRLTFPKIASSIGSGLEDEAKFRSFEAQSKPLFNKIQERLASATDYRYKRTSLATAMTKHNIEWCEWGITPRFKLGAYLLNLVIESTGLCNVITHMNHGRSEDSVELAPEWSQRLRGWIQRAECLYPRYMPCLIKPAEWTSPFGGGYHTVANQVRLVKSPKREFHEELANREMPLVYQAINALQDTPWSINEKLFETMSAIWDNGLDIGIIPPKDDLPYPNKPEDIATNEPARKAWRKAKRLVCNANVKIHSKRLQFERTIQMARKFAKEEEIYFPYQLDFRGRIYAVPMFLTPQGPDNAKGLLRFAEGKPLRTKEAADWLAIHGANLYGMDKVAFAARVQWINEHKAQIQASAEDPIGCLWWTEADKPWQFLGWCFEWAEYLDTGLDFISYLPVALDGSCNGLQHFSAMLRDEVGGKAVNLVPSDKPQDIYQTVADKVTEKLNAQLEKNPDNQHWLALGIDRSVTKRPVMVVPYGGTRMSCRDYVDEAIQKKIVDSGKPSPFQHYDQALNYITGLVWESIGEVVVSARLAMGWLQQAAQMISKEGLGTYWTTPSGFLVRQAYLKTELYRVETVINGQIKQTQLARDCTEIDPRRQSLGVSPNFVHSIDASHLVFCLEGALREGITDFAMIHDSYGTHASNTPALARVLRRSFVELYATDVLKGFADEVAKVLPEGASLPPMPPKGTLDLSQVQDSAFFFA